MPPLDPPWDTSLEGSGLGVFSEESGAGISSDEDSGEGVASEEDSGAGISSEEDSGAGSLEEEGAAVVEGFGVGFGVGFGLEPDPSPPDSTEEDGATFTSSLLLMGTSEDSFTEELTTGSLPLFPEDPSWEDEYVGVLGVDSFATLQAHKTKQQNANKTTAIRLILLCRIHFAFIIRRSTASVSKIIHINDRGFVFHNNISFPHHCTKRSLPHMYNAKRSASKRLTKRRPLQYAL